MPRAKKANKEPEIVSVRDEIKVIPIIPQELFIDALIRDLIAVVQAVAPGRDFSAVLRAERYLAEKAK